MAQPKCGCLKQYSTTKKKKNKTLVSGNAGDKNNLHPSSYKFIFLIDFLEIFFFFFSFFFFFCILVLFCFLLLFFLLVCFLKLKIYILIQIWLCWWFSKDILFSSLVSFAFFVFMFWFFFLLFFLLVCFLKLKIYILIYIQLCGWVSNKKFSPGRFPETRLFVYWLNPNKFNCIQIFTNNWLKTELIMNKKILDMKVCCYLWSTEKFQTSLLEVASVHFNKKYRSWS